jgi:DNA-binding IclR family transcriptional regulator
VSRGLGILQHRVCEALADAEDQELPLRELRRRLGDPDRSNLRRAIRGLLERELVEETGPAGVPRVALTFWGHAFAGADTGADLRPGDTRRVWRGGPAGGVHWFGFEHLPVRDRPPGETQRMVLAALCENAGAPEEGLPVAEVKAIVGGDAANTRRAIRSLLGRGLLEESADGRRIRLSPRGAFSSSLGS